MAGTRASGRVAAPGTPAADGSTAGSLTIDLPTYKRAVYERLREMIAGFELAPGDRLVETDLAARLGVSKTPVREAIALLEADGLVETFPYRGAMVRWLSVTEMTEQGFLVDALEMPAYPIVVARITTAELSAVRKVADELKRARRDREQERFARLAVEIHSRLFACTGFPRLQKLIQIVLGPAGLRYDRILVYPFDDAWDVLTEMSVKRYEAIRTRDADLVAETIRRYRGLMHEMAIERVQRPEIARYFRD
ncbi:MAG: GntR family transcriptional regulator [Chloroflexota bacterium]